MKHAPEWVQTSDPESSTLLQITAFECVHNQRRQYRYNIHDHNVTLMQKCERLQMNTAIEDRQVINTITYILSSFIIWWINSSLYSDILLT